MREPGCHCEHTPWAPCLRGHTGGLGRIQLPHEHLMTVLLQAPSQPLPQSLLSWQPRLARAQRVLCRVWRQA